MSRTSLTFTFYAIMKLHAGLAALLPLAAAMPTTRNAASSPLNVTLEKVGNSAVKATISNVGKEDLRIFRPGSILDTSAVEKAKVKSGDRAIAFDGIRKRISTRQIDDASFEHIGAGNSVEVTFDIAQTHDLSTGGEFRVVSAGKLMIAGNSGDNSNNIVKSVPYQSNVLNAKVNGTEAAAVRAKINQKWKRANLQSDCTGDRLSATKTALRNCQALSQSAQKAALSGSAEMMEKFFKASDNSTRTTVAGVFSRVAEECGSTTGGASTYYCTDVRNHCRGNVLAYTIPSQSVMVYCDLYFDGLPPLTSKCDKQDQATTTLHECTHLREIQDTKDLGYGYDAIHKLPTADILNNGDTYAIFANLIYAGCF
ncbi:metallo-endopeptidase [Purpureocillium lavendulum]|uniref:Neutral protease 2 n=1 Tax=Purpureocillium lavendulum TaxID=1247861 RepID=A0AB34FI36_9HYPO|nr:metallo-endopeptidase [Purpureocillium lavendulum]